MSFSRSNQSTASLLANHIAGGDQPAAAASFVRGVQTPLFTNASQSLLPSIYWPWVIRVDDKLSAPLGRYYMFYSTDHDTGAGGIALAYANSPLGPWTFYQKVYADPYSNGAISTTGQTETPSVIWDETLGKFVMYYQQQLASYGTGNATVATGVQSTLRAMSPDGITWTKDLTFILDKQFNSQVPGDGHTGYFTPFCIDGAWSAYHLYGGTNSFHMGFSTLASPGGALTLDPRELGVYSNFIPQPDGVVRNIQWNSAFVFKSRGRLMCFARLSDWASGTNTSNCLMGVFPISEDLRKPLGQVRIVWTPVLSWESSDLRSCTPFLDYDGTLYVYYYCRVGGSGGVQNVGVLTHGC